VIDKYDDTGDYDGDEDDAVAADDALMMLTMAITIVTMMMIR